MLYTYIFQMRCTHSSKRVDFLREPGRFITTLGKEGKIVLDELGSSFFQSYINLETTGIDENFRHVA